TPTPTGPAPYQYFLHVTATSPRPGVVRLSFPDASTIPGFGIYVIYQDPKPNPIADPPAGSGVPPYEVEVADKSTVYCYRVAALIETDNPPPPINPGKACAAANGKPTE